MGIPKFTGFIIAIALVTFFAAGFGLWFGELNNNYGLDYGNNIDSFNKMDELTNTTNNIKTNIERITAPKNPLDFLEALFNSGYSALIELPKATFSMFYSLLNSVSDKIGLAGGGALLITLISLVVIILIFVGIILAVLVKRDL